MRYDDVTSNEINALFEKLKNIDSSADVIALLTDREMKILREKYVANCVKDTDLKKLAETLVAAREQIGHVKAKAIKRLREDEPSNDDPDKA